MSQVEPSDLRPGDRATLTIAVKVDGVVARTWEGEKGRHYVTLVDLGRGERVFERNSIARATLVSRDNEIPTPAGRKVR